MARINAFELEDLIPSLPDVERLTGTPRKIDLYLCALGFEPRCLAVAERLAEEKPSVGICRYIELNTNVEDNKRNLEDLMGLLSSVSSDLNGLNADKSDFERRLKLLLSRLEADLGRHPVVVFDISVAANRLLLRTFKALIESSAILYVTYAEATIYHPTEREFNDNRDRWIGDDELGMEIGVSSIMPSTEYAGQHLDPLPNCIILFPSFRKDRSLAVTCQVDETLVTNPRDNVIWILGVPRLEANRWRTDAMKEINQIPDSAPQYEITTFDYRETLSTLERIYRDRWEKFNITISPLGSKLQAIGTALFCQLHPDTKLVFAAPRQYNATEWSDGISEQWMISFGETAELRRLLERVGTLRVDG